MVIWGKPIQRYHNSKHKIRSWDEMFSGFRVQSCVWTELFSRAFYWSTEEECTCISAVIADSLKRLRRCSDQWFLLLEAVPRGWSVTNGWRLLLSSARVTDSWLGNRREARLARCHLKVLRSVSEISTSMGKWASQSSSVVMAGALCGYISAVCLLI